LHDLFLTACRTGAEKVRRGTAGKINGDGNGKVRVRGKGKGKDKMVMAMVVDGE